MQHRHELSLAQVAAFSDPCHVEAVVDEALLNNHDFIAAMVVGYKRWSRGSFNDALTFLLQKKDILLMFYDAIIKKVLTIDGSFLDNFARNRRDRESVKLAVGPGPYDDIIKCLDRCKNLRFAYPIVYEKDEDLEGFVRDLIQLGCRKEDFPVTFWTNFFGDMSHEGQCAFAASVLLTPGMDGVSKLGSNIWYDLPHNITKVFDDCSTYQCGICFGVPVKVFNCVDGCTFHCCQDCRDEIQGPCPMCRANQNGPCGRRCRAAEVQIR